MDKNKKVQTIKSLPDDLKANDICNTQILNPRTPSNDIEILCNIVRSIRPRRIVEVGTDLGITTLAMSYNSPDSFILTIDQPRPTFISENDIGKFCRHRDNIKIVLEDSQTINYNKYMEGPIDLLFVDGCHEYNAVISDTMNALKYCNDDSIIVWHDYKSIYNIDHVTEAIDEILVNQIDGTIYHVKDSWIAFCQLGRHAL